MSDSDPDTQYVLLPRVLNEEDRAWLAEAVLLERIFDQGVQKMWDDLVSVMERREPKRE